MLLITEIQGSIVVFSVATSKRSNISQLVPNFWTGKHKLLIYTSYADATVFDLMNEDVFKGFDFTFFPENGNTKKISLEKQFRGRIDAPNFKTSVLPIKTGRKQDLFLKSNLIVQQNSIAKGKSFVAYSPNSKYIFAKTQTGQLGTIKTADISADLHNGTPLPFYPSADSITTIEPENFIEKDASPPNGYSYIGIKRFKHISQAPADVLIKLHLKTFQFKDDTTGIHVHLLDDQGTYYYGASEKKYRYIWKKLILQYPNGEMKHVTDFVIDEYNGNDTLANALALLLDHSGSMGNIRANALQNGAKNFIEKKNEKDAVTIIKYDSDVGVETPLSTTAERLNKALSPQGLLGYGGATALLEATSRGIEILGHAQGYGRKSVIVITDGNENCSMVTKGQLIKQARMKDVQVYTIGFGKYVSDAYLEAVSSYTQGSYYKLFNTSDFDRIFEDIYNKTRYYYNIKFTTQQQGEYTALLEIAQDTTRKHQLTTVFNNSPIDYDAIDNSDYNSKIIFKPLSREITIDSCLLAKFSHVTDSIDKAEHNRKKIIKEEFYAIAFPDIKFEFNTTKIKKGSSKNLKLVILFLEKYPNANIEIRGYTDNIGSKEKNLLLSQQRTEAVKKLLIKAGIASERVHATGYGENKPIDNNNSDSGRAKNRRVEFIILK